MTIIAPPEASPPLAPDPEALIEEARRRARRRRQIYGAVVALVTLLAVVGFTLFDRAGRTQTASPASGVGSSPTAAPASSRIAFLTGVWKQSPSGRFMQTELWVMNADGSGKRRVVGSASGRASSPVWSPAGQKLAFWKTLGPAIGQCGVCHTEIFVVNADGTGERNLTGDAGGSVPAWSRDGRLIVFSRESHDIPNLYVMNADGSDQRRVTQDPIHAWGSAWSPDGRRLAFASGRQGNPGNFKIYVVNIDGSGQQQLTRGPWSDFDPAWSSDGRIAFRGVRPRSGRRGFNQELHVMNGDGSEQRKLTRLSNSDGSFSWSPDGRSIAFVSDRDGNDEVYVINVDGSGLRNLTRNRERDGHPVWSPDGRTIGFVSNRGGNRDIYVMNADGSRQRNLTRGIRQQAFEIAWSPAPTK